jgi:hypothetical protein
MADASLKHMGTVGYYSNIPWNAITRYVLIDWDKIDKGMYMRAVDSMVSTMNYLVLQDRHRALTKWFFGDAVTAEQLEGFVGVQIKDEFFNERLERIRVAIVNRNGLEVVSVHQ